MFYVTMTDKFMSGWGRSENKINKFVVKCETREQAEKIAKNANNRQEMKYINITTRKPYYNSNKYFVSLKDYNKLGKIWKQ